VPISKACRRSTLRPVLNCWLCGFRVKAQESKAGSVARAYSVKTLAQLWGRSEGAIRKAIKAGHIKHFKIGTLIRISAEEVRVKTPEFVRHTSAPPQDLVEAAAAPRLRGDCFSIWPGAMRMSLAAAYVDLSMAEFQREVAAGVLPEPVKLGRGERWIRSSLDKALAALSGEDADWRDGSPLYSDGNPEPNRLDRG
jgi:excisionase family DNA binding protein